MSKQSILNITTYKFVDLCTEQLAQLQIDLREEALKYAVQGTILLGEEGINLFVAGEPGSIECFKSFLADIPPFADLVYKESYSTSRPFNRLVVRIKPEIVTMGCEDISPAQQAAPYVEPEQLKAWFESGRDIVILDTRNDYEVAVGSFDQAVDLNLANFREFPKAVKSLPEDLKQKTIVTFCTGGIRCEKATALMLQQGFKDVYQLQGGIINYFEKVGGEHYHGECFVFDNRVTVDAELKETDSSICYYCKKEAKTLVADINACPYCSHLRETRHNNQMADAVAMTCYNNNEPSVN